MGRDELPEPWKTSFQLVPNLPAKGETQVTQQ